MADSKPNIIRHYIDTIPVDAVSKDDIFSIFHSALNQNHHTIVSYLNIHVFNVAQKNVLLREHLNRSNLVYCDGTGISLATRLLKLSPQVERNTAADFVDELLWSMNSFKIFLLGSHQQSCIAAADYIQKSNSTISGFHHGFFSKEDEPELIEQINSSGANILIVGMGTPLQEEWIARNLDRIKVKIVWSAGALFDILSGHEKRGPKIMTANGMEWIWRLFQKPNQLAKRYIMGIPIFFFRILVYKKS